MGSAESLLILGDQCTIVCLVAGVHLGLNTSTRGETGVQ